VAECFYCGKAKLTERPCNHCGNYFTREAFNALPKHKRQKIERQWKKRAEQVKEMRG
jgi:hypothetical protein